MRGCCLKSQLSDADCCTQSWFVGVFFLHCLATSPYADPHKIPPALHRWQPWLHAMVPAPFRAQQQQAARTHPSMSAGSADALMSAPLTPATASPASTKEPAPPLCPSSTCWPCPVELAGVFFCNSSNSSSRFSCGSSVGDCSSPHSHYPSVPELHTAAHVPPDRHLWPLTLSDSASTANCKLIARTTTISCDSLMTAAAPQQEPDGALLLVVELQTAGTAGAPAAASAALRLLLLHRSYQAMERMNDGV